MSITCYKDGKKMVFQENVCPAGWTDKEPEQSKPKAMSKKKVVKKKTIAPLETE
jgi:hypothetical protein